MFKELIGKIIFLVAVSTLFGCFSLMVLYTPIRDGTINLKRAKEESSFLREQDTGIHHIKADSINMAIYPQGFAHAQDRMWQMEKARRMAKG